MARVRPPLVIDSIIVISYFQKMAAAEFNFRLLGHCDKRLEIGSANKTSTFYMIFHSTLTLTLKPFFLSKAWRFASNKSDATISAHIV